MSRASSSRVKQDSQPKRGGRTNPIAIEIVDSDDELSEQSEVRSLTWWSALVLILAKRAWASLRLPRWPLIRDKYAL